MGTEEAWDQGDLGSQQALAAHAPQPRWEQGA
jgi:hypothetical protein